MENQEQHSQRPRGRVNKAQALLLVMIALQVVILGWLYRQHQVQQQIMELEAARLARQEAVEPPTLTPTTPRAVHSGLFPPPLLLSPNAMHDRFNRMMSEALQSFDQMSGRMNFDSGWDRLPASPTMDMRAFDDRYEVLFSLPGIQNSDIRVLLEGRLLTISSEGGDASNGRREFNRFESRVQLPGPVGDPQAAQASFTNGILKVVVPRSQDGEAPIRAVQLI